MVQICDCVGVYINTNFAHRRSNNGAHACRCFLRGYEKSRPVCFFYFQTKSEILISIPFSLTFDFLSSLKVFRSSVVVRNLYARVPTVITAPPKMPEQHSSGSSMTVTELADRDIESRNNAQKKASHWQLVIDQTHVTPEVINWPYKGSGTEADPYVLVYIENDRRNPMLFPLWKKWMITLLVAFVSFHLLLRRSLRKANRSSLQIF